MTIIARRGLLLGGASLFGAAMFGTHAVAQVDGVQSIDGLKPGEFTWHPERQPSGPLSVIVSIPQQRVHVYRNGIRIAVSTCSTGKPGHDTPTGVFVVLQKDKNHHSSTYNNAPMPNMNRLTWSGIALHAGQLPGYPASHGCVRLPLEFSARLFTITHIGTPVIIAGAASDPWELTHPGMVLGGYADDQLLRAEAALEGKKAAADWTEASQQQMVSMIASAGDRRIMLLINEEIIIESPLTVKGDGPIGSHVLVLQGAAGNGLKWAAITHTADDAEGLPGTDPDSLLQRLSADKAFTDVMAQNMHPGMVVVLTDLPLAPDTRTGEDFVILNTDDEYHEAAR